MPTFGQPLNNLAVYFSQAIPPFLEKLFSFMIEKALDVEGIFRVPGDDKVIKHYHSIIDATGNVDLAEKVSPFVVANLITRFIRFIPNHLLIDKNANELAKIDSVESAQAFLQTLPLIHKAVFSRLIAFFTLVAKHSAGNRMGTRAISLILSPILVENPDEAIWIFPADIVELFLKNYKEIFVSMPALTPDGEFMTEQNFQKSIGDVCSIFFCQSTSNPVTLSPVVAAKQVKMCRNIIIEQTDFKEIYKKLLSNSSCQSEQSNENDRLQQI